MLRKLGGAAAPWQQSLAMATMMVMAMALATAVVVAKVSGAGAGDGGGTWQIEMPAVLQCRRAHAWRLYFLTGRRGAARKK
jgi:hypothetical protein